MSSRSQGDGMSDEPKARYARRVRLFQILARITFVAGVSVSAVMSWSIFHSVKHPWQWLDAVTLQIEPLIVLVLFATLSFWFASCASRWKRADAVRDRFAQKP
jgi:hypothetical protein